jgi:addiction module toxin, relE/stbE family
MYNLVPTPHFARQFKKLDKFTQKKIKSYLENISDNPRSRGKMLQANRSGQWRYRIGDYRVIVNIQDEKLIILALEIGHRREIYKV